MERRDILMGAGATGISLLPAATAAVLPSLQSVPLCTGVCGSCGGGCVGAIGATLWIAACAWRNRQREIISHATAVAAPSANAAVADAPQAQTDNEDAAFSRATFLHSLQEVR